EAEPDAGKIYRELLVLRALFEDLSNTAQNLIARLDMSGANASPLGRSHQLMHGANASPLGQPLDLQALVDYAQRFIDELVLEADIIGETVCDIEAAGFERLLQAVTECSARKSMDPARDSVAGFCSEWRSYWE